MKENIHPTYHTDAEVVCGCGSTFTAGSTKQLLRVEVCSQCHPFFSGTERRLVDAGGRVERFRRRYKLKE